MPRLTSKLHCWTDSTIVLAWLAKPAGHWTTFVANKVTKITDSTEAANWSHVQSEHNPADLASRGVPLQELSHPRASNVIRSHMYVDDVLSGADSAEDAKYNVL